MNQLSLNVDNDLEDQSVKFQVDGKILNELSKQVTNHIFALGELIKNSYDAQATYIKITLDLKNSVLIIDDNGIGITQENMQSILHIAKSNKKYAKKFSFDMNGERIERFTQGSKGLGLFSAFKFGNIVNWDTKSNDSDSFSLTIDKEQVIKLTNISDAKYKLKAGEREKRGTTITISLNNKDNELLFTYNHLKDLINTKRLVNFFLDDSLTIDFNLIKKDGAIESNFPIKTIKNKDLEADILKRNLFKITFSSQQNNIKFFHKNKIEPFHNYNYQLRSNLYTIKFTIYAFTLKAGEKKEINSLFLNSRSDLTPLIYINGALFNNDNIFDPSITRKIKSSKTLPQLVGFIDITCTHPDLQFNNERTDLVFNSFNEALKEDIKNINIFIQEKGKYLERNLTSFINIDTSTKPEDTSIKPEDTSVKPEDTSTKPEDTSIKPEDTSTKPEDTSVKPEDTSTKPEDTSTNDDKGRLVPFINLKKQKETFKFDEVSPLVDLHQYFENAKDSQGNEVFLNDIEISIGNKPISSHYVSSIHQSTVIVVTYSFTDPKEKDHNELPLSISSSITLTFIKKNSKFDPVNIESHLIKPIGFLNYQFQLDGIGKLIEQINLLYENYTEYDMCIASSLRVVFDLTTYRYQNHFPNQPLTKISLEDQVIEIIEIIISKNDTVRQIKDLIGTRYHIAQNFFIPGHYRSYVANSNLGSHVGSTLLPESAVKEIAMYAGAYAQLVDAYCKVKGCF